MHSLVAILGITSTYAGVKEECNELNDKTECSQNSSDHGR